MTVATRNALEQTGATARQLDYWARRGYLRPGANGEGSGNWRRWPAREVEVAAVMVRLIDAGLTLDAAARAARVIVGARYPVNPESVRVELNRGVFVEVER